MKKRKPQSREKWIKVPTKYDTMSQDYYYSNYGEMKSVDKVTQQERLLKGSRDKYGFVKLNLKLVEGKRESFFLHRIIALEFLDTPPEDKIYIVHIDKNKENNFFKNLKWVNREELTKYHLELGVYDSKTKNGIKRYKLTEAKVRLIKSRLRSKRTKPEIIARDFNISLPHLRRIEKGQHWGHV